MRAPLSGMSRRGHEMWRNASGNVAVIFGLMAIPLLALAGGGVDVFQAYRQKGEMQAALDAATLAGVTTTHVPDEQIKAASDYFKANYPRIAELTGVDFKPVGDVVTGNAAMNVDTSFLKIIGISTIPTAARSSASREDFREPLCFMAMHPTRKHTLELNGAVSVLAPDCNIYGNSNNEDDVVDPHTRETFLTGRSVQAIGYGHHFLENVTPPLEHAPELIEDPLASLAIPTPTPAAIPAPVAGCNYTDKVVQGGTLTLTPGVYCGGLTIKGGANVTFGSSGSPGFYYIKGGDFTIDASQVTGDDVVIVLTDNLKKISWNSSTVRLSGATTGPYAGIVVMGVRFDANHAMHNSTIDLHGVVYLPYGTLDWMNTGAPVVSTPWTAWIIDGVSWSGDGAIRINFQPDGGSVPYPAALTRVIPRKGTPRLLY